MYQDYEDEIAYEWSAEDDYPNRRQESVNGLERTISYFCNADMRTANEARGIELSISVETLQQLCDAIPTPPTGMAQCHLCNGYTSARSGICEVCGREYAPF